MLITSLEVCSSLVIYHLISSAHRLITKDYRNVAFVFVLFRRNVWHPQLADRLQAHRLRVDPLRVDPLRVDPLRVDHLRVDHLLVDHLRVDHLRVDPLRVDHLQAHRLRVDQLRVHQLRVAHLRVHHLHQNGPRIRLRPQARILSQRRNRIGAKKSTLL